MVLNPSGPTDYSNGVPKNEIIFGATIGRRFKSAYQLQTDRFQSFFDRKRSFFAFFLLKFEIVDPLILSFSVSNRCQNVSQPMALKTLFRTVLNGIEHFSYAIRHTFEIFRLGVSIYVLRHFKRRMSH